MNINLIKQSFGVPKISTSAQLFPIHRFFDRDFSILKATIILAGAIGSGLIPGLAVAGTPADTTTEVTKPDIADAQVRIRELERQMQQMAEQLKAMETRLASDGQDIVAQPVAVVKPSGGSPVEATFKNGLVFRDATGDWALRLYARAQLDYRHFAPDEFSADTFSMRRARIGAIATFFDDFTLRIEGEYSEDKVKMNDGYLDYTHFKPAMIRVGQFKTMHGLERSQGAMDLNFMERAMTESLLGSTFDRGIMLHGAPITGLYYNLAYINGTGQNVDESNAKYDSKDYSLRVVGNLAQWAGWKDSVVHIGGFHVNGNQAAGALIPKLKTEGRGVEFFKVADTTSDTDRTLSGFESALAYGPVKYQGEYIRANFEGTGFDRNMSAWYASLQWLVTGESYAGMYKNGAFGGIAPKNNFRYGNGGWGALELGARYTHFDASDFNSVLASTPTTIYTDGADAWTLGAKWILNPNAQMQLNYVHTAFDTPITLNGKIDDYEDAMNMRMQFDF